MSAEGYITLSPHVLTIGIDYRCPRGGVAQVESVYKELFRPYKFIPTVVASKSKLRKACVAVAAVARFVWRLTTDREIRIVHVHGSTGASFWRKSIFIYVAKAYGKKVVYHVHGGHFKVFAAAHPARVRRTLRRCDVIVALSEGWKEYFSSVLHCERVVVVKNIIAAPVRCPHKSAVFTLLFLGRLGQNKGIYDLLAVLREHHAAYRGSVRLLFGGDGEVEQCCKYIKDYGLDDIAQYVGWVVGQEKIDLLNSADAYVLPSYSEGLPISILEAMSYGLPIIATPVGGIPEIVHEGDNGVLVTPGDQRALAAAIDTLRGDATRRYAMGERAAAIAQAHLPAAVATQLNELYATLMNEG